MKTLKFIIGLVFTYLLAGFTLFGQNNRLVVLQFEATNTLNESVAVTNLVRIEAQKLANYKIVDKYDTENTLAKNSVDIKSCFGEQCAISAGKLLDASKVLQGTIQRIGEKIIIELRLYNVTSGSIEKSVVYEYVNMESELQRMIELSLQSMFDLPKDEQVAAILVANNVPINDVVLNRKKLNGPRMGFAYFDGLRGNRLQSDNPGGYDMYPVMSQFGYQFETQYLSSGDLEALLEVLPMIGGLEQNRIIPSITIMNGFRFRKSGFEFGFGPNISLNSFAKGYTTDNGKTFNLERDYIGDAANKPKMIEAIDSRGDVKLTSNWVWAVGKTFHSGSLNIPVNAYVSPNKSGWMYGLMVGFNIQKK